MKFNETEWKKLKRKICMVACWCMQICRSWNVLRCVYLCVCVCVYMWQKFNWEINFSLLLQLLQLFNLVCFFYRCLVCYNAIPISNSFVCFLYVYLWTYSTQTHTVMNLWNVKPFHLHISHQNSYLQCSNTRANTTALCKMEMLIVNDTAHCRLISWLARIPSICAIIYRNLSWFQHFIVWLGFYEFRILRIGTH